MPASQVSSNTTLQATFLSLYHEDGIPITGPTAQRKNGKLGACLLPCLQSRQRPHLHCQHPHLVPRQPASPQLPSPLQALPSSSKRLLLGYEASETAEQLPALSVHMHVYHGRTACTQQNPCVSCTSAIPLTSDKAIPECFHGPVSLPPVKAEVSHAQDSCVHGILCFQIMHWPLCRSGSSDRKEVIIAAVLSSMPAGPLQAASCCVSAHSPLIDTFQRSTA